MEFYRNVQTKYQDASLQHGLDSGELTESDVELIREFVAEKKAVRHWKDHRVQKSVMDLRQWRRFIKKPYKDCAIEDIHLGINAMMTGLSKRGKPFAANTQHDYVKVLRWFLLWGVENKKFRKLKKDKIQEIQVPSQNANTTEPSELLTADDVVKLIESAKGSQYPDRDQALISVLFESGVRIGELATLFWRDITTTDYGFRIFIKAQKTEHSRFVGLQMSAPYLTNWKNSFPGGADLDKPIFVSMWERKQPHSGRPSTEERKEISYKPMEYFAIVALVKRITERSGLDKRVHCHLFRKSRITDLIRHNWQESIVKKSMWGNLNTKQFSTYVVLDENDLDAELMERSGFKPKQETAKENPLTPRTCIWCKEVNPATNSFCSKCGRPVSDDALKSSEAAKSQDNQATLAMTTEERMEWLTEQMNELRASIAH